jgi:uncharacterized iron-regulated protein
MSDLPHPLRATIGGFLFLCLAQPAFGHDSPPPAPSSVPGAAAEPLGEDQILDTRTAVVDLATLTNLEALIPRLADRRVVFVGEAHDRYEDHLNQLAIIRGLHQQGTELAIGMEMFQQPFQPALDAYIAGEIDEDDMLRRTDYFERWRFDYRLYRPILRFAREKGIPVIALNLEREITGKVGDGGLESLSADERARIPAEIDNDDSAYRERVKAVFDLHPKGRQEQPEGDDKDEGKDEGKAFERFLSVQLLWDEGMAERAARYLQDHPNKRMVILAGSGHLEYGQGIPQRLLRRLPLSSAIVLNGGMRDLDPQAADYLLFPRRVELAATGRLGVMLDTEAKGPGVAVQGFSDNSGAAAAGMKEGDRILQVGDKDIGVYADIRLALMDSRPGQKLSVEVERGAADAAERLTLEVELH